MKKQELQKIFPDTYAFFDEAAGDHPFWKAIESIDMAHISDSQSLLPDLEQVFSSLHLVDGHRLVKQHLLHISTHAELMHALTKLYVAYLYRNHGVRVVQEDHGYDIELEIADQLLALGIVDFHNFDAPQLQFSAQIENELAYLAEMKNRHAVEIDAIDSSATVVQEKEYEQHDQDDAEKTEELMNVLKEKAAQYKIHPKAHHHVVAVMTHHGALPRQKALTERIAQSQEEMKKYFPHLSGVLLIDPESRKEKTTFIPFHGEDTNDLEQLLNRIG